MTEQEAIKEFKERLSIEDYKKYVPEYYEAMEIAVSALEGIRQYRDLGTVKELREMKESALSGLELANIWAALEKLKKYEAIGTEEELREVMEKQRAKKPILNKTMNIYFCPVCERRINHAHSMFCSGCGQAIDWNEGEQIY